MANRTHQEDIINALSHYDLPGQEKQEACKYMRNDGVMDYCIRTATKNPEKPGSACPYQNPKIQKEDFIDLGDSVRMMFFQQCTLYDSK